MIEFLSVYKIIGPFHVPNFFKFPIIFRFPIRIQTRILSVMMKLVLTTMIVQKRIQSAKSCLMDVSIAVSSYDNFQLQNRIGYMK